LFESSFLLTCALDEVLTDTFVGFLTETFLIVFFVIAFLTAFFVTFFFGLFFALSSIRRCFDFLFLIFEMEEYDKTNQQTNQQTKINKTNGG
jgi:hypothetical protein